MTYAVTPFPAVRRPCGVEGHAPSPGCDVPQRRALVDAARRPARPWPPRPAPGAQDVRHLAGQIAWARDEVGPVAPQRQAAGDEGRPVASAVALHVGPRRVSEPAVDFHDDAPLVLAVPPSGPPERRLRTPLREAVGAL